MYLKLLAFAALVSTAACAQDHAAHAGAGHLVSRYVAEQTGSQWKGCAAALGVGVLKEVYDKHNGGDVELSDALFTGAAGCVISYQF